MIHTFQAQIVADSGIATPSTRDLVSVSAQVAHLGRLAPDVIGVTVELERPLHYFPGQYCNVEFRGFPPRCFSPSYPLEGGPDARLMHFHIQAFPDGVVSAALGETIRTGHGVRLTGPFGRSFLRSNRVDGTVLVSSGTGFAPMWGIAVAAITERPERELIFVVGARKLQSFYMHRALCRLALFPNVTIIPIVSEPQDISSAFRSGQPSDYLPRLSPNDVVYASAAPALTERVTRIARAAGAEYHVEPFVTHAEHTERPNFVSRLAG
jgi:3-phenylpropionate/trans-cinnamate dioxygenase ferredoxin reductase subunit